MPQGKAALWREWQAEACRHTRTHSVLGELAFLCSVPRLIQEKLGYETTGPEPVEEGAAMSKGWANRDQTRLLREASHGADVVQTLSLRTEVEVLEELQRFLGVRLRSEHADLVGYVYVDFLDAEPADPPAPDPKYECVLHRPRYGAKNWDLLAQQSVQGLSSQSYFISTGLFKVSYVWSW